MRIYNGRFQGSLALLYDTKCLSRMNEMRLINDNIRISYFFFLLIDIFFITTDFSFLTFNDYMINLKGSIFNFDFHCTFLHVKNKLINVR